MNILVTGAAGFIGMHCCERLLQAGHAVIGIDSFVPYYDLAVKEARWARLTVHSNFTGLRLDLVREDTYPQFDAFPAIDQVLHLAAQAGVRHATVDPGLYVDANVRATTLLLHQIGRRWPQAKIVYASSSSVYGRNIKLPFSESDPVDRPASLYAATKRATELVADTYQHLFQLDATGLRFFTAYGPWGRPDMAPWLFTDAICQGQPLTLFNEGKLRRDFTYIDDIVDGIMAVLAKPHQPGHRVYNLGNSDPVTVNELIATIEQATGRKAVIRHATAGTDEVDVTYADVSLAKAELDFSPRTSLTAGMSAFVEWFEGFTTDFKSVRSA